MDLISLTVVWLHMGTASCGHKLSYCAAGFLTVDGEADFRIRRTLNPQDNGAGLGMESGKILNCFTLPGGVCFPAVKDLVVNLIDVILRGIVFGGRSQDAAPPKAGLYAQKAAILYIGRAVKAV